MMKYVLNYITNYRGSMMTSLLWRLMIAFNLLASTQQLATASGNVTGCSIISFYY